MSEDQKTNQNKASKDEVCIQKQKKKIEIQKKKN